MGAYSYSSEDYKEKREMKDIIMAIKNKLGMREYNYAKERAKCPVKYAMININDLLQIRQQLKDKARVLAEEGDNLFNKYLPNWNEHFFSYHLDNFGEID